MWMVATKEKRRLGSYLRVHPLRSHFMLSQRKFLLGIKIALCCHKFPINHFKTQKEVIFCLKLFLARPVHNNNTNHAKK